MKKTGGRKSRDTLPLNISLFCVPCRRRFLHWDRLGIARKQPQFPNNQQSMCHPLKNEIYENIIKKLWHEWLLHHFSNDTQNLLFYWANHSDDTLKWNLKTDFFNRATLSNVTQNLVLYHATFSNDTQKLVFNASIFYVSKIAFVACESWSLWTVTSRGGLSGAAGSVCTRTGPLRTVLSPPRVTTSTTTYK